MAEFGKRNLRPAQVSPACGGAAILGDGGRRRDARFDAIRQAAASDGDISQDTDNRRHNGRSHVQRRAAIPWKGLGFLCLLLIGIGSMHSVRSKKADLSTQKLQVREEAERIVLDWTGPVEPPMNERISAALDKFRTDPRRIVLVLNSPGGNVAHGRAVMASIRDMGRLRRIDTRLEADAICASMCVPIYMQGARRSADPAARFMFHEAKLVPSAARMLDASAASMGISRKSIEQKATSMLYTSDLRGTGVSWQWLGRMRADIVDREVWRTARQLKDEESGIVVALGPEGPE